VGPNTVKKRQIYAPPGNRNPIVQPVAGHYNEYWKSDSNSVPESNPNNIGITMGFKVRNIKNEAYYSDRQL
jgi:hypothetical protein